MNKHPEFPMTQASVEVVGKVRTVARLHELLDEAQKWVTLVSPYLAIEKLRDVERKLLSALRRKVVVTLVIRETDAQNKGPSPAGLEMLYGLTAQGLKLYVLRDLHAKVYISEKHALVTSLNLLESSFNNSIEIGMWIPAGRAEYNQVRDFVRTEVGTHTKALTLTRMAEEDEDDEDDDIPFDEDETGHCIRCGDELELDPDKPYCSEHYAVWARYSNPDYKDNFCHGCGDDYSATKNKPFCRDCFNQYRDRDDGVAF